MRVEARERGECVPERGQAVRNAHFLLGFEEEGESANRIPALRNPQYTARSTVACTRFRIVRGLPALWRLVITIQLVDFVLAASGTLSLISVPVVATRHARYLYRGGSTP
eukprot:2448284-Rhodomonas_salina.1